MLKRRINVQNSAYIFSVSMSSVNIIVLAENSISFYNYDGEIQHTITLNLSYEINNNNIIGPILLKITNDETKLVHVYKKTMQIYDIETKKLFKTIVDDEITDYIYSIVLTPENKIIATCNSKIKIWDLYTGNCDKEFIGNVFVSPYNIALSTHYMFKIIICKVYKNWLKSIGYYNNDSKI